MSQLPSHGSKQLVVPKQGESLNGSDTLGLLITIGTSLIEFEPNITISKHYKMAHETCPEIRPLLNRMTPECQRKYFDLSHAAIKHNKEWENLAKSVGLVKLSEASPEKNALPWKNE